MSANLVKRSSEIETIPTLGSIVQKGKLLAATWASVIALNNVISQR